MHFYEDIAGKTNVVYEAMKIAIDICNVLQTVNMSLSFILYCVVNTAFRKTLTQLFAKCLCMKKTRTENYKMISDIKQRNNTVENLD